MRKTLFILLSLFELAFTGCTDDKDYFDISIPAEDLYFTPIAGGAIMHYKLPASTDVLYIRARYKNAHGEEVVNTGSHACDSLLLLGFNEAQKGVRALVSLCDRNDVESGSVEVSFDTKDSGPVAFFNNLELHPIWGGISLTYSLNEDAKGMAHLFYIGEDPVSKQPDTLLLRSFVLNKGADTLEHVFQQLRPTYSIVVRSEDFRGYMVKEKVWENVKIGQWEQLPSSEFTISDPEKLSQEDDALRYGLEYLTDGDLKGEGSLGTAWSTFSTYLAGPECLGKTLFVIDMKEQRRPAEIRLYAMLNVKESYPFYMEGVTTPRYDYYIWNNDYTSKLPCNVTLFGSNTPEDYSSWVKLAEYAQAHDLEHAKRWCASSSGKPSDTYPFAPENLIYSGDALNIAEPAYLKLSCSADGDAFRYLKVVVNDVFYAPSFSANGGTEGANLNHYVTLQEVEVYTAK